MADQIETWLEEFLYRGRPPSGPGSELAPDFHVILGRQAPDPLNPGSMRRELSLPLTPAQAAALGFVLPELISTINSAGLDRVRALEAENETLTASVADLQTQVEQLTAASAPELLPKI
jgi:hypothetical protein